MTEDILNVAPLLHPSLRDAIGWNDWLDRRNWSKNKLLRHMNDCDFPIKDIRIHDGTEQVAHIGLDGDITWFDIEQEGSGFNGLYAGIFKYVLGANGD